MMARSSNRSGPRAAIGGFPLPWGPVYSKHPPSISAPAQYISFGSGVARHGPTRAWPGLDFA